MNLVKVVSSADNTKNIGAQLSSVKKVSQIAAQKEYTNNDESVLMTSPNTTGLGSKQFGTSNAPNSSNQISHVKN